MEDQSQMDPMIQTITKDLASVKTDMAKIGVLVDRLDVTIEKLTEVASNVSKLLAVQVTRMDFHEKNQRNLEEAMERRRVETEGSISRLNKKIDGVEDDLQGQVKETRESISGDIEDLKETIKGFHDSQEKRVSKLENWMWIAMGGGAVIVFLLNKIDLSVFF